MGELRIMENMIVIEEQEKENARALSQSFVKAETRSRAFANVIGSEVCIKFLKENNLLNGAASNLHDIRKILEEFDISDIILSNIHIDVRVIYNENEIFIPKTHFEYNLTPDIYIVLKVSKNYSNSEILGFFEPKMVNKNNANEKYYFIEKEKLSSPNDIKNYIENYKKIEEKNYNIDEIEQAEVLMIAMADNNVSDVEKKKILEYLKNSGELREKYVEFENFEMLAYQAVSIVGLNEFSQTANNIDNLTVEDIVEETSNSEINETLNLSIEDIVEEQPNEEKNVLGGLVEGAAILGTEIAGTAIASAALTGAAESAENIKDTISLTKDVSELGKELVESINETTSDTDDTRTENYSDVLSDNLNNNADTQEKLDETLNLSDSLGEINQSDTLEEEIGFENIPLTPTEKIDGMVKNIEENYQEYQPGEGFFDTLEDLNYDNSGEFTSDELEFTNNEDFDIYNNNQDMSNFTQNISDNSQSGTPKIQSVIQPPISEATELVSLESIQANNIQTPNTTEGELEKYDMDNSNLIMDANMDSDANLEEFGYPEVEAKNISDISITQEKQDSEIDENITLAIEDIPFEENNFNINDELSSEDFIQEMPEEINLAEPNHIEEDVPVTDIENIKQENSAADNFDTVATDNETVAENNSEEKFLYENLISDFATVETNIENKNTSVENPLDQDVLTQNMELSSKITEGEETPFAENLSILDELEDISDINELPQDTNDNEGQIINNEEITNIDEENSLSSEDEIAKTVDIFEENKFNEEINENSPTYTEIEQNIENNNLTEFKEDTFEQNEDSLGVLYTSSDVTKIEESEVAQEEDNIDFRPENRVRKFMPVFAILTAFIIAGSLAGLYIKNRNSIDSETIIQTSPENELISPETDNTDILLNNGIEPAIPATASDISELAKSSTEKQKTENKVVSQDNTGIKQQENLPKKPLNANKTITLKKLSWEVPDYLSYSENIRKYLQAAGKSIRLTLSSDLLLTNDYIYSNQVKVNIKLTKDGAVENAQIAKSSGSSQVDNVVLQTVKETLNVVKPAKGEVPTPNYKLGLIIYL